MERCQCGSAGAFGHIVRRRVGETNGGCDLVLGYRDNARSTSVDDRYGVRVRLATRHAIGEGVGR